MIIEKVHYKRVMAVILCFVMIAGAVFIPNVSAQDYLHSGIYAYVLTESGAMIVDCDESISGALQIPEQVDGVQVTSIGENAFNSCDNLTSVTVPKTVTEIGEGAFSSCNRLTSVYLPDGIAKIEEYSFSYCRQLSSIRLPNDLLYIGESAFENTALTIMVLPDSVKQIGRRAFQYCSQLTTVSLPAGIEKIAAYAFSNCYALTEINIPNGLASLGESALIDTPFWNSAVLQWSDGGLYLQDILLDVDRNISGVFTVRDGTKLIADDVFGWDSQISEIVFPDSIRFLSDGALTTCGKLRSLTIPDSVERIGELAFPPELKELHIGKGVRDSGDNWWSNLVSLQTFTVSAENNDFLAENGKLYNKTQTVLLRYLPSITETTFRVPDTVKTIGANAFTYCDNLQIVILPDGLQMIGVSAFEGCKALEQVKIPDSVNVIDKSAFCRCSSMSQVDLGIGVQSIEAGAFISCTSLKAIRLPNSVTKLGYRAFGYCSALSSVVLPDSLQEIEHDMFTNCGSLENVSIPDTVVSIDSAAFKECTSLQKINLPYHLEWIGNSAFYKCTSLSEVELPDSVLKLGEMSFEDCTQLNKVDLSEQLVEIPANAFRKTAIESVQIPEKVTSINERAFFGCTNLKTITIQGELTNIGPHIISGTAFYADNSHWSNDILYLDHYLICAKKTISGEVNIRANTSLIANAAFINCKALTKATIPNSVSTICDAAFSGCTALTSVTISASVQTVSAGAFSDCNHLETIQVPHQVTDICYNAFRSCSALKQIRLPKSLNRIGKDAFDACASITDVRYAGTEEDWNNVFVENGNDSITAAIFRYTVESNIDGISAQYKKGCFRGKVSLVAEQVAREDLTENYPQYEFALTPPPGEELTDIYLIRIVNEEGLVVQPTEGYTVALRIPIPEGKDYTKCRVCHVVDADSAKTESYKWNPKAGNPAKPFTVSDDGKYFIIEVSSFSPFVVFVEEDVPEVSIRNNPGVATLRYGETLVLTADVENLSDGAKLVWETDSDRVTLKPSADGKTCEVTSKKTGTVTVSVKAVNADGKTIESEGKPIADSETIRSKAGFFYKLIAFIKRLFGIYVKTTQTVPHRKSNI